MRKDYYKELNHYREQERLRRRRLVLQAHLSIEEEEEKICIPVEIFDSLQGLDESVLKLVNEKVEQIKGIYQERCRLNLRQMELLNRKITYFNKLSPNAYGIINLTLHEIFESLAIIETDSGKIWKCLNDAYGKDFFIA